MFLYRLVFSPDKKTKSVTLGVLTHFLLNILIRRSPACSRKKKPPLHSPTVIAMIFVIWYNSIFENVYAKMFMLVSVISYLWIKAYYKMAQYSI